ncbi:MAG: hypothetical protein AMXMBFR83_15300 [Phycisphaerae bacterium]
MLVTASAAPGAVFYGPSPYLSPADSPFNGVSFQYFYLENFEDGLLNVPGVTASAGRVENRGIDNDSVDADDGHIDGMGRTLSYWSDVGPKDLVFTFNASVLGSLPTHAGIVWTDVGFSQPPGPDQYGNVTFEAFGPSGASLGTIGPCLLGDGLFRGQTAEDRFFGAYNPDGISSIRISMPNLSGQPDNTRANWEVDHLQYGAVYQCLPPAAPPRPRTGSVGCGWAYYWFDWKDVPADEEWFWQYETCGTSTGNAANNTTYGGTCMLRARKKANPSCWGPCSPAVNDGLNNSFSVFEACATGPEIPYDAHNLPSGCPLVPDPQGHIAVDFDKDGDVDQNDFGVFQRCISGHKAAQP